MDSEAYSKIMGLSYQLFICIGLTNLAELFTRRYDKWICDITEGHGSPCVEVEIS